MAEDRIAAIAARHGLSVGAVGALDEALRRGLGGGGQWSHPDLGGMGQWSGGGMLQIGDMFNDGLKARVRAALDDLARTPPAAATDSALGTPAPGAWWPDDLGQPASTGAQNAMRYACFPDRRRLVVERDGRTTLYDTGSRRLTGFAQAQGRDQTLTVSGPDGPATLDDLAIVG